MKTIRLILVLLGAGALAGLVLALARPGSAEGAAAAPGRITVNGVGTVTSVPDRAGFAFGVETRGKTAAAALAANAAAMQKVIDALKGAGIAAADLQTAQVSLEPRYSPNGNELLDYAAANTVSATVRGIDRAGRIVDVAVAAGANSVAGPTLTVSDTSALYRAALRAAVADARGRATALATASGRSLGAVVSVSETSAQPPVPFDAAKARAATPATPVEPGTQEIEADVTVTFAMS
jgi:uncharacterized protein YggE